MTLRVIGAGMPRTGTMSLKIALEQLGFGPCHHMSEVYKRPHLPPLWGSAFDGTLGDFEEIFKDYSATTDAPAAFVFDKLAARYPQAKVILSLRDADSWYASMQATILTQRNQDEVAASPMAPMFQKMGGYLAEHGGPPPDAGPTSLAPNREAIVAWFNTHNARVQNSIAPERLLLFEAAQGWEPLCAFLGVSIPQTPYPRVNDAQEFHATAKPKADP